MMKKWKPFKRAKSLYILGGTIILAIFLPINLARAEAELEQNGQDPQPAEMSVEERILQVEKILAQSPHARGYIELGRLYASEQRFVLAEQQYKKAILMEPGNPAVYQLLGELYGYMNRPDESIDVLKMAHELDPSNDAIIDSLAGAYFRANEFGDMMELYHKSVKEMPDNMNRLARLGQTYALKGKEKKAIKIYEEVLEKKPELEWVRHDLIKIYSQKKDMKKVNEHLSLLKRKAPDLQ